MLLEMSCSITHNNIENEQYLTSKEYSKWATADHKRIIKMGQS
jgi:hypothetical protein